MHRHHVTEMTSVFTLRAEVILTEWVMDRQCLEIDGYPVIFGAARWWVTREFGKHADLRLRNR